MLSLSKANGYNYSNIANVFVYIDILNMYYPYADNKGI